MEKKMNGKMRKKVNRSTYYGNERHINYGTNQNLFR